MTKIATAFAAALLSSASFVCAALADTGDYYEGISPETNTYLGTQKEPYETYGYTGSVAGAGGSARAASQMTIDHGDYHEGANRPT